MLAATSRINRHLNDVAFRHIALGENYFAAYILDDVSPSVQAALNRAVVFMTPG